MLLLAKDYGKSFDTINVGDLAEMPDYLRDVAELIISWKSGQQEFILHTSGSAGKPKPIYLEREIVQLVISSN
ncbi:MAG: hypothetical protein EOP53_09035 [Sphingobacteriales bacterium]|nr:MAG: hypothetical protein EOP53_09035 [Sphingobacteriales bacterium]